MIVATAAADEILGVYGLATMRINSKSRMCIHDLVSLLIIMLLNLVVSIDNFDFKTKII